MEVEVAGPNRDLHSGLYGGAVMNPLNALTKMIASLTDAIHSPNENYPLFNFYKGIETIPFFYRYFAEMSRK